MKVRLTFLNHARYPLRLYFVGLGGVSEREVAMGMLDGDGKTLTFDR